MVQNNIAVVCTGFPIPTETFIISQVIALLKLGYEVNIFPYTKCADIPGDYETYALRERIYPAVVPDKSFKKRLVKAMGLAWHHRRQMLRLMKTINPFVLGKDGLNLTVFYSSLVYVERPPYHAFIGNFGESGVALEKLKRCGFLNSPVIPWFHGYDITSHHYLKQLTPAYRKLFAACHKAVGVSKAMCNQIEALGCPPEKIVYLPYAPSDSFFNLIPSGTSNNFLAVGRLVEKKSPMHTLLAFEQVQHAYPEAGLIIVGTGPLEEACRALVKERKIGNVVFRGVLSHPDTLACFREAFCFVQHSVVALSGDSEGTPVGILEAGAAGLAVVATRHGGIPDVVLEGETGLLVDEGDLDTMAEAMILLYTNRGMAQAMGSKARERVKNLFSINAYTINLGRLIQSTYPDDESIHIQNISDRP